MTNHTPRPTQPQFDFTPQNKEIPYGHCHCGCGRKTHIAKRNRPHKGHVKGKPVPYLSGHHSQKPYREPFIEPPLPNGTRAIQLTHGKVAIVDAADYEWLSQWRWHVRQSPVGTWYAQRSVRVGKITKFIGMHRDIMNAQHGIVVDHINGDGLDNRRANLRLVNRNQNQYNSGKRRHNTSGYKGVWLDKPSGKWYSQIMANRQRYSLGFHNTAEEAARAYDKAAIKYHGEFAKLNFPE